MTEEDAKAYGFQRASDHRVFAALSKVYKAGKRRIQECETHELDEALEDRVAREQHQLALFGSETGCGCMGYRE